MNRRSFFSVFFMSLLCLVGPLGSGAAQAAAGDLDASFGNGQGFVDLSLPIMPCKDTLTSSVLQPDGKLVMAGYTSVSNGGGFQDDFALVRYNPDGSLDASFGVGGKVITPLGTPSATYSSDIDYAYTVLLQPDGKLVAAGSAGNQLAVVRYNPDGSLDAGFAQGGKLIATGSGFDEAFAIARLADGKLLVAGRGNTNGVWLARINTNGALDATFGNGGLVVVTSGILYPSSSLEMIQQQDGKLVLAQSNNGKDFVLLRVNRDGVPDTTFDGDGVQTITDIGSGTYAHLAHIIQQADGKLVVVGKANDKVVLVRYNADGSLDAGFDGDGKLFSVAGGAVAVRQQLDGKLLVGSANYSFLAFLRYNTNGSLDTGFDGDGVLPFVIPATGSFYWNTFWLDDAGRYWVSGSLDDDYLALRLNPDGSFDNSFGQDGKVRTNVGIASNLRATDVLQQQDGKLVALGILCNSDVCDIYRGDDSSVAGVTYDVLLVRYRLDGSLDTGFGDQGVVVTDVAGISDDFPAKIIQQADGKLVVAGSVIEGGIRKSALLRYREDGSLDTGFAVDGKLVVQHGSRSYAAGVVQQANGKLVVAGSTDVSATASVQDYDFYITRYNPDGSADPTFGDNGVMVTRWTEEDDFADVLFQQVDGKLVVAGNKERARKGLLVRYSADGALDAGFGTAGKLMFDAFDTSGALLSLAQLADGKLVAAGWNMDINAIRLLLVRINPDGQLDLTFDADGILGVPSAVDVNWPCVVPQEDGKLLVSYSDQLIRLLPNGSRDTSFGSYGAVSLQANGNKFATHAAIRQYDGRLLLAGGIVYSAFSLFEYSNLGLFRLETGALDSDGDGYIDALDAFPANPDESVDTDKDGIGDVADTDDDGDGMPDDMEDFPLDPSKWIEESDRDNIADNNDNCPYVNNPDQADIDNNGVGNACDAGSADVAFLSGAGVNGPVYDLASLPDTRLLAVGNFTQFDGNYLSRIVRLRPNGRIDTAFNSGTGANNGSINAVVRQPDGKVIAAGGFTLFNGGAFGRLVRLLDNGSVDTGFVTGTGAGAAINALSLQPDGKILIAGGFVSYNGASAVRIARLNADGSLDAGFNTGSGFNNAVNRVVLQPDGKILVGGNFTYFNGVPRNRIARLNADGSLDASFNPGTGANGSVNALALDNQGRLLLGGGFTAINGMARERIARLLPDGGVDTSFLATAGNTVNAIVVQADDRVLLGGAFVTVNGQTHNHVARLKPDGTMDEQFVSGAGANDIVNVLVVQADGMVLAGGNFTTYDGKPAGRILRIHTGDLDRDGIENASDAFSSDQDEDGVPDSQDAFPQDPTEWLDSDGDGIGNNADPDDDNDGVPDYIDADPLNDAIANERSLLLEGGYKGSSVRESISP